MGWQPRVTCLINGGNIRSSGEFVFWEEYGGLGDALQYSTLPEMFLENFGKESFLSNAYKPRNIEIAQLVWWENPYIRGWSSQKPNAGSAVPYVWSHGRTFIENIEASHGLNPQNVRPKIYYKPKKRVQLDKSFLVDISATTLSQGPFRLPLDLLEKKISELIDLHGAKNILFVQNLDSKRLHSAAKRDYHSIYEAFPNIARYEIQSIFHYVDALASCQGFIGQHSGGVALASAVQQLNESLDIECLISSGLALHPRQTVEKIHNYPDVRYTSLA